MHLPIELNLLKFRQAIGAVNCFLLTRDTSNSNTILIAILIMTEEYRSKLLNFATRVRDVKSEWVDRR